ncbi:MAG TPA: tetratricopeptide repeat protein [Candidatus Kapabacteria bacterium]|nr:tetratricopeptide repeat protein [Candidatus Kapabacteria bacterium]
MKTLALVLCIISLSIVSCTKTVEPLVIPDLQARANASDAAEFKKAQETVTKLRGEIKAHPEKKKNYSDLAQVFIEEARVTGRHHQYYPVASRLVDEALTKDSLFFDALLLKATIEMTKHRFTEAKQTINTTIRVNPYNASAYGVLADANTELGLYDEAATAVDKMMGARPDLRSYARASYQREIRGDLDGALSAMRMAVDAGAYGQENREWAAYQYGNLYLHDGKLDTAAFLYKGILEERPNYGYALSGLAMVAASKKDYGTAIENLVKASQVLPEHLFIEQLSDIYLAMGDTENAKVMEEKVVAMFEQHEKNGWNIDREYAAYCTNHNIHLEESLKRSENDLKSRPNNIDALDTYAWVLCKLNRATEAKPVIEKALQMHSLNPSIAYHGSVIALNTGDITLAEQLKGSCKYVAPGYSISLVAAK